MDRFKKLIIVTLVIVNVAMLGGLFYTNMPQAQAQMVTPYKTTNYVTCTVQVGSNIYALAVIDLASRKMVIWKWNISSRKMEPIRGGRNLITDFMGK